MSNKSSAEKKYYLFDCKDFVLGRMSTRIARLLQGKNSPNFAPHKESKNFVVVINSDKLNVTGRKKDDKVYHSFSGYPGGITSRKLGEMLKKDSRKVVWNAVYGMLPKNKLRNRMMKRLFIFKDENHNLNNIEFTEEKYVH